MSRYLRNSPWITPSEILDPPLIPHPQDDEFDQGSGLDASWNRVGTFDDVTAIDAYANFGGVNGTRWNYNSIRPSWYMVQGAANSATPNIYKDISPPTNVFYWCRGSFNYRNASLPAGDHMWGFGLYNSTFLDGVTIQLRESTVNQCRVGCFSISGGVVTGSAFTTMDGAINTQAGSHYHAVGIQKRATLYDYWALSTSGHWQWLFQTTHTTAFTRAPLYWQNSNTAAPGCMVAGFDFFRVREGVDLP